MVSSENPPGGGESEGPALSLMGRLGNGHRWLGLVGGLVLAVVALTGSLIVAGQGGGPTEAAFGRAEYLGSSRVSLDRVYANLQAAHPRRYGPWTLELPLVEDEDVITAWYLRPIETEEEYYAPLMVSVDARSGQVLASRFWGETGLTWLVEAHSRLFLGRSGAGFLVVAGAGLVAAVISGLWLGWPGRQGPRCRGVAAAEPTLIESLMVGHRWLGVAAAPVLLVVAATGIGLALPGSPVGEAGSQAMGHPGGGREIRSTAEPAGRAVGIEEAVLVARGLYPHARLRRVTLPAGETGAYQVEFCQRGEGDCRHPSTRVWVDRYSGQIRDVSSPGKWSWRRRWAHGVRSWHTGAAFGALGRAAWLVAGLAPGLLFLSGLLRWAHRRGWVGDRPLDWHALRAHGLVALSRWRTLLIRAMVQGRLQLQRMIHRLRQRIAR